MRAYKSSNALSKLPSTVTGLQPIGTEVRVCHYYLFISETTIMTFPLLLELGANNRFFWEGGPAEGTMAAVFNNELIVQMIFIPLSGLTIRSMFLEFPIPTLRQFSMVIISFTSLFEY